MGFPLTVTLGFLFTISLAFQLTISNALTFAAQKEEFWEKSVEMERIAGSLITMPIETFRALDEL